MLHKSVYIQARFLLGFPFCRTGNVLRTYNVTHWRVCVTTVAVEKEQFVIVILDRHVTANNIKRYSVAQSHPRRLCSSVTAAKTSSHYQTGYLPQHPYLKAHSICNFCNRMTFKVTHPSQQNKVPPTAMFSDPADTTKKYTYFYNNINNQTDATIMLFINNLNQFNMFRAMISPIIRSTRLCLQLVV